MRFSAPSTRMVLFLLMVVTFLVYQPGLYGDYEFDDSSNITDNPKLVVTELTGRALFEAAFSSYAGTLKRPVSMLSFAFNASTTGLGQPLYFKLTNLFIHLLNGALVFWLAGLLLRSLDNAKDVQQSSLAWVQPLVAGVWLLHPINLTSVLYIVQRMTSLSATFALLAVGLYILGRQKLQESSRGGWWLIVLALLVPGTLSLLAKENGVLVPLLMLVVEWVFFGFQAAAKRDARLLKVLFILTVLLPAIGFAIATAMNMQSFYVGYVLRDFTMAERLFTQPRVIWFYLRLMLFPSATELGIFHDDFIVSRSIVDPPATIVAIVGLFVLLVVGLKSVKKLPVLSFGILWFLAGHVLESSTLPLEMVHEHRNYLPSIGPAFAAIYYLCSSRYLPDTLRLRRYAAVLMLALLGIVTLIRSEQWGSLIYHAINEAENHPGSERANQQLGRMYLLLFAENGNPAYYAGSIDAFNLARKAKSVSIVPHASLMQLYAFAKQPVDPTLIPEFIQRLETLPLPPSAVPSMRALVDCQMYAYCHYPDEVILALFEAALRNPKGHISVTTSLRVHLAQYYVDKIGDVIAGANALEAALVKDPDHVDIHLNLARVYRVMQLFDRAQSHLDKASVRDRLGYRKSDIDAEREKLARDRKTQASGGPRLTP